MTWKKGEPRERLPKRLPSSDTGKRKRGRPTKYSEELAARILERISNGESLTKISEDADMPGRSTISQWLMNDDSFYARFLRAKRASVHWRVGYMTDLADRIEAGEVDFRAGRVVLEHHRWMAGKDNPALYSEKQQVEMTGKDGKDLVSQDRPADRTFAVAHAVAFLLADAARQGQSVPLVDSQQDQDAIDVTEEST